MRRSDYTRLLLLSFCALFLELMMIRWVPAVVRLVAYYTNLLLISSFLGLGIGALIAGRGFRVYRWLPLVFLAYVGFLLLSRQATLPSSPIEFRFFVTGPAGNYLVLVGIFVLNTALFVPIGEQIGELFNSLPPLKAYGFDLAGSLCGTVLFGLFAFYHFSPLAGIGAAMLLLTWLLRGKIPVWSVVFVIIGLQLIYTQTDPGSRWSPYYYIRVTSLEQKAAPAPPADLRTMTNPPIYLLSVNQDFYQYHGSFDQRRYSEGNPKRAFVQQMGQFFRIPYAVRPRNDEIAVIGAGGGPDVEAALLAGARHVDAVDIDPVLIRESRRLNAAGVYDDPRVTVHIDDARAFFERAGKKYDLLVFSFLDSQGLSSAMANIRLDSYVYTVESMRAAFRLVKDDGMMSMSFATRGPWMIHKLTRMVREGTGLEPVVYNDGQRLVLLVSRAAISAPPTIGAFVRLNVPALDRPAPTDDWPFLYLEYETIPRDYLIVIVTLVIVSAASVLFLRRGAFGSGDGHFFLMGIGFLLLQTRSVLDCSLYFGATWLVTTIVVAGVLLMVLAANVVAQHVQRAPSWYYAPLLASLLLLFMMPRSAILNLPFSGRLLWALLVAPIPIFFAGIIFSSTFRMIERPADALGANLVGATIGGFLEYFSMVVGSRLLLLVAMGAYLGSFVFSRRAGLGRQSLRGS